MKIGRSLIHIENLQIKSQKKAEKLCKVLDVIEKEFGIHEVEISFKNLFVCPDIDLATFSDSGCPMERLVGRLLTKLDKKKYGKQSKYKKI